MFDLPPKALTVRDQLKAYFDTRIPPSAKLWQKQVSEGQPVPEIENILRSKPKALGLRIMLLPRLGDDKHCQRLSILEFTAVAHLLSHLE